MKKVAFIGVAAPPKYDLDSVLGIMRKHKTSDPEIAFREEQIPFETTKEYSKIQGMQRICGCYTGEELAKYIYLDGDKLVVYISDIRSCCVCQ